MVNITVQFENSDACNSAKILAALHKKPGDLKKSREKNRIRFL